MSKKELFFLFRIAIFAVLLFVLLNEFIPSVRIKDSYFQWIYFFADIFLAVFISFVFLAASWNRTTIWLSWVALIVFSVIGIFHNINSDERYESFVYNELSYYDNAMRLYDDDFATVMEIDDEYFSGSLLYFEMGYYVLFDLTNDESYYIDGRTGNSFVDLEVVTNIVYKDGLLFLVRVASQADSYDYLSTIEVYSVNQPDEVLFEEVMPTTGWNRLYEFDGIIYLLDISDDDLYIVDDELTVTKVLHIPESANSLSIFANHLIVVTDGRVYVYSDDFVFQKTIAYRSSSDYYFQWSGEMDQRFLLTYRSLNEELFYFDFYDESMNLIETKTMEIRPDFITIMDISSWNEVFVVTTALASNITTHTLVDADLNKVDNQERMSIYDYDAYRLFIHDDVYSMKNLYDDSGDRDLYLISYEELTSVNKIVYSIQAVFICVAVATISLGILNSIWFSRNTEV